MQKLKNLLPVQNLLKADSLKKVCFRVLLFAGLMLGSTTMLFAQCDPFLDPFCGEPIPLDGGIVALLAAGAAYGYKKIKDNTETQ